MSKNERALSVMEAQTVDSQLDNQIQVFDEILRALRWFAQSGDPFGIEEIRVLLLGAGFDDVCPAVALASIALQRLVLG